MESKNDLFSKLLLELEAEIGMKGLDILVLNNLILSIRAFKAKNNSDLNKQLQELIDILFNTEPKYGILRYQLGKLNKEFSSTLNKKIQPCTKTCKNKLISIIKGLIKESKIQQELILKNAEKINVQNKTILIHDQSQTVHEILKHYKKKGKKFRVIVAEQDYDKTHGNIEFLHNNKIPYQVVPAYMLSHLHEEIDMVFFGGLTLKDNFMFVMSTGTHGIITEFNLAKVPIYIFINTLKFSLWKSTERVGVYMHKHLRKHAHKPIEYERIKYSHDRVPIEYFEKIITNDGVLSPKQLEKLYKQRYLEHANMQ